MQTIVRLMLLAVLFVVVMETHNYGTDALVHGKFWRRCKKVDCRWGAFSKWGKCSESCGATGVQSRRRGIAQQASCGGEKCKGYQHQERACNRYCLNGGHLSNGHCGCTKKFHGPCCQWRNVFRGRSDIPGAAEQDVMRELEQLH